MKRIIFIILVLSLKIKAEPLSCEDMYGLAIYGAKNHLTKPMLDQDFFKKFGENYLDILDSKKLVLTQEEYKKLILKINKNSLKLSSDFKEKKCEVFQDLENSIKSKYKRFDEMQKNYVPKFKKIKSFKKTKDRPKTVQEIKQIAETWVNNESIINNKEISLIEIDKLEERNENLLKAFYLSLDPHSGYIPNNESKGFMDDSKGDRSGIGILYSIDYKGVHVKEVIKESPLERSEIKNGDYILKINNKRITSFNPGELAKQLSVPEGSLLSITFLNKNKEIKTIQVKTQKLKNAFIKVFHKIIEKDGKKTLVIRIPSFYYDPSTGRGSADDMIDIYREVRKDLKIDSVILDLRSNPGGAVIDAINMIGFFVGKEIALYYKDSQRIVPNATNQDYAEIKEPLVIMTNKFSASASEIVSGALKDLKRGVVVGDKTTFGKGSMQNVEDYPISEGLGLIKYTMSRFYTPSGKSTQIKGVEADIIVPDLFKDISSGEIEYKHALSYDEIDPIMEMPEDNRFVDILRKKSKERLVKNKIMAIETDEELFKYLSESDKILNESFLIAKDLSDLMIEKQPYISKIEKGSNDITEK